MEVRRYRITGVVQGVGFRPFINKIAEKNKLNGWIYNDSEGVLIEVEGEGENLSTFAKDVITLTPPMARIENMLEVPTKTLPGVYKTFEIKKSVKLDETKTLIPPDSFVCEDCVNEMFDKNNRRYKYPFINCTNCGPRYSIIKEMPYDRAKTTMKVFKMCPECQKEYLDINDRRYHAQPNACPKCGPQLNLRDCDGNVIKADDIIEFCQKKLLEGKIFAVKSLGGFHLVADANNDYAVRTLRSRKKRDAKPFALMVKDIEVASKYVSLCDEEAKLLNSVERPIVILKKKPGTLPDSIAPNNPSYGMMLPSTPLHYLLLDNESLPVLIMTSGNISGHPIVYTNEEALNRLNSVVDYFLLNNRDIHIRVDDSIVRYTTHEKLGKPKISHIRRSRGFAPYPIKIHKSVKSILALGPELKATVALSKENEIFVSQHIGDVKNDYTFKSLNDCAEHMKKLLSIEPEIIACDAHPGFRTTVAYSQQEKLQVMLIYHHHAHMASCMAENKIENKVIGVIFDGTGYGLDGTIWGGEFLVGDYSDFKRVGCIAPFFLLGGDKAVKEPFRLAIDLLYRTYGDKFQELDLEFFESVSKDNINILFKMAQKKINAFQTTSMGRLFDGVSALMNICTKIEYEGQAAIELESLLNRDFSLAESFTFDIINNGDNYEIDYRPMVRQIVNCIKDIEGSKEHLSRRFHSTIVSMICKMCLIQREECQLNDVVLSGGVFMNEYIMTNAMMELKKLDFNVFNHSLVPTNDGGISLGQIMIADARKG